MFPKQIEYALKYFNLWGFHYIPSARIGGSLTSLAIFFCHFGLCVWFSFGFIQSYDELNSSMELLDALNIFLYNIMSVLTYWLITYDSITAMKVRNIFWCVFSEINQDYSMQRHFMRWDCLTAALILLVGNASSFVIAPFIDETSRKMSILPQYLFQSILDHRIMFYFLHMEVIVWQLQKINSELTEMREQRNNLTKNRFKWTRDYYHLTFKMVDQMNEIFGWSQFALVLLSFELSLTLLNNVFRQFHGKFDNFDDGKHFKCKLAHFRGISQT